MSPTPIGHTHTPHGRTHSRRVVRGRDSNKQSDGQGEAVSVHAVEDDLGRAMTVLRKP